MRIAILGYGKMGKAIARLVQDKHEVVLTIGNKNQEDLKKLSKNNCDVAIEFSTPDSAFQNIKSCLEAGVPVISGTTGWLSKFDEIELLCKAKKGTFFYASNFSLGVNLFFELNTKLAKMMNRFPQYNIELEEIHHVHKVDAPSGTAISIAEGILASNNKYNGWVLDKKDKEQLPIKSIREGEVPGTHSAIYTSDLDKISIRHEAFTRDSFAIGAITAAEWIIGKKGMLTMTDLMQDLL